MALSHNKLINLGFMLAQEHRSPALVFWQEDDWSRTWGVYLERISDEDVSVAIRNHGLGFIIPAWNNN